MRVVITVKDYGKIRRRYLRGESQRQIAKAMHISRNTVAKYCAGEAVPWERKAPERSAAVLSPAVVAFIRCCMDEDAAQGLRKQQHTAKCIYDRLVTEQGFSGGESTVRAKVRELRQKASPVFVPLVFAPGDAMQVDWGEAVVYIGSEKQTIYFSALAFAAAVLRWFWLTAGKMKRASWMPLSAFLTLSAACRRR